MKTFHKLQKSSNSGMMMNSTMLSPPHTPPPYSPKGERKFVFLAPPCSPPQHHHHHHHRGDLDAVETLLSMSQPKIQPQSIHYQHHQHETTHRHSLAPTPPPSVPSCTPPPTSDSDWEESLMEPPLKRPRHDSELARLLLATSPPRTPSPAFPTSMPVSVIVRASSFSNGSSSSCSTSSVTKPKRPEPTPPAVPAVDRHHQNDRLTPLAPPPCQPLRVSAGSVQQTPKVTARQSTASQQGKQDTNYATVIHSQPIAPCPSVDPYRDTQLGRRSVVVQQSRGATARDNRSETSPRPHPSPSSHTVASSELQQLQRLTSAPATKAAAPTSPPPPPTTQLFPLLAVSPGVGLRAGTCLQSSPPHQQTLYLAQMSPSATSTATTFLPITANFGQGGSLVHFVLTTAAPPAPAGKDEASTPSPRSPGESVTTSKLRPLFPAPPAPSSVAPVSTSPTHPLVLDDGAVSSKDSAADTRRRLYECDFKNCDKKYYKSSHLKAHFRTHTGEKPFLCVWGKCGRKFSRSDELSRHKRTHTGEKKFVCPTCNHRFMRSDHLTKHIKRHNTNKKSMTWPMESTSRMSPPGTPVVVPLPAKVLPMPSPSSFVPSVGLLLPRLN